MPGLMRLRDAEALVAAEALSAPTWPGGYSLGRDT